MRTLKALLVVIISYLASTLLSIYVSTYSLTAFGSSSTMLTQMLFQYYGFMVFLAPIVAGLILWAARSGISHVISRYVFKSKEGKFRDLLYGFGMSHFPLIFIPIFSLFFFLGNIGIFLGFFLSFFFMLLIYAYFVNSIITFQRLEWKRSLVCVVVAEVIIMFLAFFLLYPMFSPVFNYIPL